MAEKTSTAEKTIKPLQEENARLTKELETARTSSGQVESELRAELQAELQAELNAARANSGDMDQLRAEVRRITEEKERSDKLAADATAEAERIKAELITEQERKDAAILTTETADPEIVALADEAGVKVILVGENNEIKVCNAVLKAGTIVLIADVKTELLQDTEVLIESLRTEQALAGLLAASGNLKVNQENLKFHYNVESGALLPISYQASRRGVAEYDIIRNLDETELQYFGLTDSDKQKANAIVEALRRESAPQAEAAVS